MADMFGSLLQIRAGSHENCEIREPAMTGLESLKVIILAGILRWLDAEGVGNLFGKQWKLMCLNCEDLISESNQFVLCFLVFCVCVCVFFFGI